VSYENTNAYTALKGRPEGNRELKIAGKIEG
jgi:hypothetical protein